MKTKFLRTLSAVLMLMLLFSVPVQLQTPAEQKVLAENIRNSIGNGIFVGQVKVYDDTSLQLMLNAARQRLAALQSFDQTGLLSRIGAVTGASLQQQSFSAQIMGPPIPGSTLTSLGGTGSTATTVSPTGQTVVTNVGQPVQNETTTNPQQLPVAPSLPANSLGLPTSGFSVSSGDALNEMMQLASEIANLQLLLEGALSDRFVANSRFVKPKTTLGFPITISAQEKYKDAVAIVEIEAANWAGTTLNSEPPTVTALLPREKTYNVASLTDKMTSIGGGMVSQVISGGASFLRGRKSYYLVQDQDTLAMMHPVQGNTSTAFAWQFRPVLGQRFVKSGMKQTFVQLAAPLRADASCFGGIRMKTYWRKYDRKHGVLKDVIPESIRVETVYQPVATYDKTPIFENVKFQDLGSGLGQVAVEGKFMIGSYVRIGPNIYREGVPGFSAELTQIRFVANSADIAKHRAFLVSREGTETEIVDAMAPINLMNLPANCGPFQAVQQTFIKTATDAANVSAYDNSNSVVSVKFWYEDPGAPGVPVTANVAPELDSYVLVIGGKVFGLSDAPIERYQAGSKDVLRAVVPNSLLQGLSTIDVKPLLWRDDYSGRAEIALNVENSSDKIVAFGALPNGNKVFLIYGSKLSTAKFLVPSPVALTQFEDYTNTNSLRKFELTPAQMSGLKQVMLQKAPGERPVTIAMPASDPEKKPLVSAKGRVIAGTGELMVGTDMALKLNKVTFQDKSIDFTQYADKKLIKLRNLSISGVTITATEVELEFEFEGGVKSSLKLDIVNSKVEMITRTIN